MNRLISALRLLIDDPGRFYQRLKIEFAAPTTRLTAILRRFFTVFYPNRGSSLARNNDRLLFVYDTLLNPITFDFLHYLYWANWRRKTSGKKHIDIIFVRRDETNNSREIEYVDAVGADNINWRISNLIFPLTRLFATVGRVSIVDPDDAYQLVKSYRSIYPEGYSYSTPKTAVSRLDQAGLEFDSVLTIPQTAKKIIESYFPRSDNRRLITITLRSYDYIACRNSDIESWVDFAASLDSSVYRIIFIPDASANGAILRNKILPYEIFDSACWNIELRAAIYHRAWMNMGVAGGPLALSGLMSNVWTIMIDRSLDYPIDYYNSVYSTGVVAGKAPNFYSKSCHMHLGKDDKQTISNIFSEYIDKTP